MERVGNEQERLATEYSETAIEAAESWAGGKAIGVVGGVLGKSKVLRKSKTVAGKSRKQLKEIRPKYKVHKPKSKRGSKKKTHDHELTRQQRNKSGTGNKMKTDHGNQKPHYHDENHNVPNADNNHYRLQK